MSLWTQLHHELQQTLCPAGEGVFTVHTGQTYRERLQKKLYGGTGAECKLAWSKQLEQLPDTDKPLLLAVPSDAGGGIQRGANWGPLFIRDHFYHQKNVPSLFDLGDVRVNPHLLLDDYLNEETIAQCRLAMYKNAELPLPVSPLSIADNLLTNLYASFPQKIMIGLGGDNSVSYPFVKNYLIAKHAQEKNVAVLHFDAHTDLLAERLGIEICFGSWAYHILEYLPAPDHLIQIGIRSSAQNKNHWVQNFGVQQHWANEVNEQGAAAVATKIIEDLKSKNVDEIYISFDIDALDKQFASATGTPESGGLSLDDTLLMLNCFIDAFPMTGADLMEVAPMIGHEPNEPETTLHSAVEILNVLVGAAK